MHVASLRTLVTASDGFLRALRGPTRYSPREVRLRLQPGGPLEGSRTAAVQAAATQVGSWMRLLPPDAAREHNLGLAATRLPSVIFWFRAGLSAEQIGRRLTPLGESCYGDRAIDAACTLIAALLNSSQGQVCRTIHDSANKR
jgi:hypothetical protein